MHILFFSDNFSPESNALAIRTHEHAKVWVSLGHQVTVVTCAPNFPKGRLYPGYKNKWLQSEIIDGIQVRRVKTYMSANTGIVKRILDYMSFGFMATVQGLFIKKVDVVIGSSPQPFVVPAAWCIAKIKRIPFVFELRDIWPESVLAVGAMRQGLLIKSFEKLMHFMYQQANLIICVTEAFKLRLIEEKINANKIQVIKNGADFAAIKVSSTREQILQKYNLPDKILIGYIGTVGLAHALEVIISAANKLKDQAEFHFIIMGAGANQLKIQQLARSAENISVLPDGCRQEALNVLNALQYFIVHLRKTPLFKAAIPSKIFEAMALKKTILMGVEGEGAEIVVNQAQSGLAFEPENAEALTKLIKDLVAKEQHTDYGENGYRFALTHYNRETLATKMLEFLQEIVI